MEQNAGIFRLKEDPCYNERTDNKMKKLTAVIIAALFAAALLASCSSSDMSGMFSNIAGEAPRYPQANTAPGSSYADSNYSTSGGSSLSREEERKRSESEGGYSADPVTAVSDGLAEKIIYTITAEMETIDFDATIESIYELLAYNGGFIENSYIGGRNTAQSYYGWQTYRNANFTLRIPKDRLNAVTTSLDSIGNVTSLRSSADNITSQFYDTQSRLNSYRTQEERLLSMLSKAENVTEMIEIESRLADIRYQIESLTTTLRNWQGAVDYSTLTLYISEVAELTEISPVQPRTYWQQIGDGFTANTKGVGAFFMNVFKWIVINTPVFVILAVLAIIAVVVIKRLVRRRKSYYNMTMKGAAAYGTKENDGAGQNGIKAGDGQHEAPYGTRR